MDKMLELYYTGRILLLGTILIEEFDECSKSCEIGNSFRNFVNKLNR